MPELPEVETVRRTLLPFIDRAQILDVEVRDARLRYPVDPAHLRNVLQGAIVRGMRRRSKYLLVDLNDVRNAHVVMLVHLGMSGRLGIVAPSTPLAKHDHVILTLQPHTDNTISIPSKSPGQQNLHLRYNDARRFGWIEVFDAREEALHPRLRVLGFEPFDAESFTPAAMLARAHNRSVAIKSFLMDASHVVGVGNIYASEALHRAGIHPSTLASAVSHAQWKKLVAAIVATLQAAIAEGGTTLRDFRNVSGESGYFARSLQVYGRAGEPCLRCKGTIQRMKHGTRATYFCGSCQTQ